jgi:hypothetical protein
MDVKIEEDRIKQTASVQSSKYLSKFLVSKLSTSSTFFKIELENGPTPSQLSGAYSNIAKANEAILEFLLTAKETQAAKNERLDKERKERNAVTNSKGS